MPAKDTSAHTNARAADTVPGSFYHAGMPEIRPQPRPESTDYWIPGTLLLSFVLIVYLRVFDWRRFSQLLGGFLRMASVSQFYREEFSLTNRVSFLLMVNFLLTGALFLFQTMTFFSGSAGGGGVIIFGLMAAALLVIYFVKLVALRMAGVIFQVKELATEYGYNVLLFNKTLGLVLFPVAALLAFAVQIRADWLVWIGLVAWSIVLIYRILRGVLLAMQVSGISAINLFLYLCTLEILPFIVLTKVFSSNF